MTTAPLPTPWWATFATRLSPIEEQPRLVFGIEASVQPSKEGTPSLVIHNPAAATYLKFDPNDYELLPLIDGSHTVKALVIEYYRRHGVLALPRVAGLVNLLRSQSFLIERPADVYAQLGRRQRAADPGVLLARLYARGNPDRLPGQWGGRAVCRRLS